jgi:hypothetical protein
MLYAVAHENTASLTDVRAGKFGVSEGSDQSADNRVGALYREIDQALV